MDETPIETLIENKTAFTPEGDDNDDDSSVELDENVAYQSLSDSDSDDEFKKITHFSAEAAYDILFNQLSYTKIFLDYDLQKELSLEIGCHVSNEHPWKTVKKELLEEYLTDSTVETENLKAKLSLFGNDSVLLVGYHCPPGEESSEDGVFIVYDEIESILIATELIKKLEIWKRFQVKRALNKKPSRTIVPSRLDLLPKEPPRPRISVELQTSHETVHKAVQFSFRTSTDCRDGYLELRPLKTETFQNVHRKRIAQGIQSAAQRIDRAQQTDPTFPTNAHTQYSYEIQSEEDAGKEGDKESEVLEPEEATKPGTVTEVEKVEGDQSEEDGEETLLSTEAASQHKPVAVSNQIKELIRTLEFNQIDMYRIEYQTIGVKIPKFRVPFMEELFCFADIGRTGDRRVSHIEWHPKYSGLFIATYTWDTLSTFVPSQTDPKVDPINKIILQPNYTFMWSLEDSLSPVLAFESPREVSTVSFHPLDPTCLIGGLVNGQVIIWDLTEIVEGLGASADDSLYREDMRKFLNWTKHSIGKDTVKRSAISCLEFSPTERITNIKWLNSNIYLSSTGEIRESSDGKQGHRYFVTSSMDGTIAFWNMAEGSIPEEKEVVPVDEKKKNKGIKKKAKTPVPELKALIKTKFAHFDRKFRPQFVVVMQEPISSFSLNAARFLFSPIGSGKKRIRDLSKRITFQAEEIPYALEREFTVEDEEEGAFRNNILATTLSGDVIMIKWKSQDADGAAGLNRQEKLILNPFPSVHDGPVVAMDKNHLMPLLVITIGQNTMAIWRTDYIHGAIYWQRREAELTDCKWSLTRPSAFFLTRVDGCVEIWDLISSTREPCLIETISGGILTTVSQHLLPISADLLAVGDHNSNVRIFKLPTTFTQFAKEDEDRFVQQINKEVARKEKLRLWQNKWKVDNEDILNAKQKLKEKERTSSQVKQILQTSTGDGHSRKKTAKKSDPKKQKSLIEKSELKWQQMNMKRLMAIMTTIKDIDPKECNQKTLPIREQRAYSALKKAAIKREFSKVESDFAEMRSRILPVKEDIKDRKEIVSKLVRETILSEEFNEKEFEDRMEKKLQELASDRLKLSLTEIKLRGRHTREILNKSSGGNFVHKEMYEHFKKGRIGSSVSHLKSSTSSPDKAMFSINETEY